MRRHSFSERERLPLLIRGPSDGDRLSSVAIGTMNSPREKDENDPLRGFRSEFFIPHTEKGSGKCTLVSVYCNPPLMASMTGTQQSNRPFVYLCGSTIGLQPKSVTTRTRAFLDQWADHAVLAGAARTPSSDLPSWFQSEKLVAKLMAPIVGAQEDEVVVMGSLTANLHYLLATFYRPSENNTRRTRIIIEEGVFSSDLV